MSILKEFEKFDAKKSKEQGPKKFDLYLPSGKVQMILQWMFGIYRLKFVPEIVENLAPIKFDDQESGLQWMMDFYTKVDELPKKEKDIPDNLKKLGLKLKEVNPQPSTEKESKKMTKAEKRELKKKKKEEKMEKKNGNGSKKEKAEIKSKMKDVKASIKEAKKEFRSKIKDAKKELKTLKKALKKASKK